MTTTPLLSNVTNRTDLPLNRSSTLYLMNEALARAQSRERLKQAEHARLARDLAVARRRQRRAERAARRARRLAHAASLSLQRVS